MRLLVVVVFYVLLDAYSEYLVLIPLTIHSIYPPLISYVYITSHLLNQPSFVFGCHLCSDEA